MEYMPNKIKSNQNQIRLPQTIPNRLVNIDEIHMTRYDLISDLRILPNNIVHLHKQ